MFIYLTVYKRKGVHKWAEKSIFYQIYPLGFCGAPKRNDGITVPRIKKVEKWIPHMKKLGVNALYLSPIFASDQHGYDTRDYRKIDCRLGCNDDFKTVCKQLKDHGIRIVLDGVFNHVGRGFWAFLDVLQLHENSPYKDWFFIDFNGDSDHHDGFWYEGWEGHYEMVKLNLKNEEVVNYLFDSVRLWIESFDIDGLRLDVAYSLDKTFMQRLRMFCTTLKADFFLLGEVLFDDYNLFVNQEMLHSCTNYECRKGLYSSFNDMNLFEISYSLQRQFGQDHAIYRDMHLLSFADNHDVTRVATILKDKHHLPLLYGLLFGMPGIPCIYYGSEWGVDGDKYDGNDDGLRQSYPAPIWNDLSALIAKLAYLHCHYKALLYGDYKVITLTNKQLVFERAYEHERIWVIINADNQPYLVQFDEDPYHIMDLLTDIASQLDGGYWIPAYGLSYWKLHK